MGESTIIDIQCWFIHGSDALGCKVVLVSDHPGVHNETMNITRNNIMSASGTFNSTQPVYCYNRVFAFDIEINNTLSNVVIEGKFQPTVITNSMCSGMMSLFSTHMNRVYYHYLSIPLVGDLNHPPLAAPIAIATVVLIITIIVVAIIIFLVVLVWHKKGMSYKVTVIAMVISKVLDRDSTDGIETTPNEVYGVSTDDIETTPNEVYGISTHPLQGHVYEDVKSIRGTSTL